MSTVLQEARQNSDVRQSEPTATIGADHENTSSSPGAAIASFWADEQAPLPPPQELQPLKPTLLTASATPSQSSATTPSKSTSKSMLLDASELKGRRIHLCLAPDQAAQEVLSAAAEGAGASWVKRWGGWHVTVGRPVMADGIDALEALAAAAGNADNAVCPWELRSVQYSLRIHKCGIGLPCFCQSFLKYVTRDEAVWMGPSQQLMAAADQLRKLGWGKVEASDFRLTLGPREEVRHVLSDMVAALWDARWVWVIAIEQHSGSGKFVFDWASAKPAMVMRTSDSAASTQAAKETE